MRQFLSFATAFLAFSTLVAGCATTQSEPGISTGEDDYTADRSLRLVATTGERIDVQYGVQTKISNSNKPSSTRLVAPFQVKVTGLAPGDTARAVYVQKEHTRGQCGVPDHDSERALLLELDANGEGSFDKPTSAAPYMFEASLGTNGYCFTTDTVASQLAVVVNPGKPNERWLVDPYHQHDANPYVQHNFGLMFAR